MSTPNTDPGQGKNPFPGPQPYRASDRDSFRGREDLAYHLEGHILANGCMTVYGPSGAGKSSLVQAAVVPSLIDKHEIRVVRVDGWPEDQDPTTWLADAVYAGLSLGERPADVRPVDALIMAVQRAARRSSRLVLVYLDQMEQLFYASRKVEVSGELFDALSRLVDLPLRNLRVVLSLREDYLGRFRDRLGDRRRLLDHGFRVGPLTVAELSDAVCQTAAAGEPPQIWDEEPMRALMLQVRVPGQAESEEAEAQAAYAQIVCRALFQERAQGKTGGSDVEAEPILRRYLDATLDALGELREAAQRLLEEHLVTADGSRTLRTEKELSRLVPPTSLTPILAALEGAAILHAEQHQGSRYFEIGHDWLARKVFEQRQQREQEEAQRRRDEEQRLERERERAATEAKMAGERRRRRVLAFIAAAAALIAAGAVTLMTIAYRQKRAAEAARAEAQQKTREAEAAQREADDERLMAGYRELESRGRLPPAIQLLLAVGQPELRRGWVELANDALDQGPPLVTLAGHKGPLSGVAYSPNSAHLLTFSDDGTARVWSAAGEGEAVVLRGHEGPVVAAAWSPDGQRVATASSDGTARVWAAGGKGEAVVLRGHEGAVVSAAWSLDGRRVVTASEDGTARVWAADGKGEAVVLRGHGGPVRSAAPSADGARVLTASEDGTARIFAADGAGSPVVLRGHTGAVLFATWTPGDLRIVTTSADGTARIFAGDGKGSPVVLRGHTSAVGHAAVSSDGARVATASDDGTARLWSVAGEAGAVLSGHAGSVTFVAFRPGGSDVVTASTDRTARLWPAGGEGPPVVLAGHEGEVRSAAWAPGGASLVTASADSTAKVWSVVAAAALLRDHGAPHAAFLEADGARLVSVHGDGAAVLRRVDGEGEPVVLSHPEVWVAGAAWSPDGARVVTASFDRSARVFQADGKGTAIVLAGHSAEVRGAAWSPDSRRVVTVSDDRTARIFQADGTGTAIVLAGHTDALTSAAWSPGGDRVVTTSLDNTARLFAAGGGEAIRTFSHDGDVHAAAWSPGGDRVATASADGLVRVWGVEDGALLLRLKHDSPVLGVRWAPGGAAVATWAADGTVRVWDTGIEGRYLVLEAPAQVLALTFAGRPGQLRAVTAGGAVRTWELDIPALRRRLAEANLDCLPWELRALYLREAKEQALLGYKQCEERHGRRSPAEQAAAGWVSDRPLGADERRMSVPVLPSDARVEVDGAPALRRDGAVTLTGKVKETRRVHVSRDARICDFVVTIQESGAPPAPLDLGRCPGAKGGAGQRAGEKAPDSTVQGVPDSALYRPDFDR